MTQPPPEHTDLEPAIGADELTLLEDLAARLRHERPAPPAAFRGTMRAQIAATLGTLRVIPRPRWLWLKVAGATTAGSALLALVAVGTAGAGPFTP